MGGENGVNGMAGQNFPLPQLSKFFLVIILGKKTVREFLGKKWLDCFFLVFCFFLCGGEVSERSIINRQQTTFFFLLRGIPGCVVFMEIFETFVSQHQWSSFFSPGEGPAIDEDLPSNEPNEEDEKPHKNGSCPVVSGDRSEVVGGFEEKMFGKKG